MRRLGFNAAKRCEEAEHPRCRCRCHGALHGAKRIKSVDDTGFATPTILQRRFFEELPETDPHRITTDEERREARRRRGGQQVLPL